MIVGRSSNFCKLFLRLNVPSEIGTAECMQFRPPTFYYINRSRSISSYFFHQSFFQLVLFLLLLIFGKQTHFFSATSFPFQQIFVNAGNTEFEYISAEIAVQLSTYRQDH